ncbi:MAG: hypothetical protein HY052_03365 [Proteobacteria bacterium]|nr:hypothetical protein [Pseudomonadota bacterium]
MHNKFSSLQHKEPLLRETDISPPQPQGPRLSVVTEAQRGKLTRKEQEACNRATD